MSPTAPLSPGVAVVIPALNCQDTLNAVLAALPADLPVYVVDDGSTPPLTAPGRRLLRHPRNRGYGAAQKTGYTAAAADGHERVVLVHGDGQYDLDDTLALAAALDDADVALGSRFLADPSVIPAWRRWGNRVLTGLANLRFGRHFSELHTGSRAFRLAALARIDLDTLSDDYLFDQQLLVRLIRGGARFAERPCRVRYDDEVQSIAWKRAVVYAAGCVREVLRG